MHKEKRTFQTVFDFFETVLTTRMFLRTIKNGNVVQGPATHCADDFRFQVRAAFHVYLTVLAQYFLISMLLPGKLPKFWPGPMVKI